MIPETRRANYNSNNTVEAREKLQRLLHTLRVGGIDTKTPYRFKYKQLYIKVDLSNFLVTVHTKNQPLAKFHRNPTLAEAVIMARRHCEKYHQGVPVLEYIIQ